MGSAAGMYIANRDVVISTTLGHVLRFKKGVPMFVPVAIRSMMLGYGILPVEGEVAPEEKPAVAPADPLAELPRDERIDLAIKRVAERNNADDFTAGGLPSKNALEKETGFEVTPAERNAAWKRFRQT